MRFSDDIDLLGGSEELQHLTEWLEKTAVDYGMEISSDKGKILVTSIKRRLSTNIRMNRKVLEEVDQFKYLVSAQTKDGTSKKEANVRLAQTQSPMTTLAIPWKSKAISFPTLIKLYKSLVLSIRMDYYYGTQSRPRG